MILFVYFMYKLLFFGALNSAMIVFIGSLVYCYILVIMFLYNLKKLKFLMFTGSIIFIMYWLTVLWKHGSHWIYATHVSDVVRELHDPPRCFRYCSVRVVHVLICERVVLLDLQVVSYLFTEWVHWFMGWILKKTK